MMKQFSNLCDYLPMYIPIYNKCKKENDGVSYGYDI